MGVGSDPSPRLTLPPPAIENQGVFQTDCFWPLRMRRAPEIHMMANQEEHFRRLERMYLGARINRFYTPEIHVSEGHAEVKIAVRPDFFHAAHALHGSVYFKALDDASFFSANSVVPEVFVLTVSFNVVLVRPVDHGIITAFGQLVHRSRSLLVAEAKLKDEEGTLLATGHGTFMPSKIPLGPEVGYE